MKLHEVLKITEDPYFRKMRVESGWLYNFWSHEKHDYLDEWVFVPESSTTPKKQN